MKKIAIALTLMAFSANVMNAAITRADRSFCKELTRVLDSLKKSNNLKVQRLGNLFGEGSIFSTVCPGVVAPKIPQAQKLQINKYLACSEEFCNNVHEILNILLSIRTGQAQVDSVLEAAKSIVADTTVQAILAEQCFDIFDKNPKLLQTVFGDDECPE